MRAISRRSGRVVRWFASLVVALVLSRAHAESPPAPGLADLERNVAAARAAAGGSGLLAALEQLGRARLNAGSFSAAFAALDEAVRLAAAPGATTPLALADLRLYRADAARLAGNPVVAEAGLRDAIAAFDRLGPDGARGRVNARNMLASLFIYWLNTRYDEAERLAREAQAIAESAIGPESIPVASALASLGKIHELRGEFDAAEEKMRRALALMERAAGPEHRSTIITLRTLAYHYQQRGLYHLAEPLNVRIYETERKVRPEHPAVAAAAGELGWLFQLMGDYPRAEALLREALARREQTLGADSLETAVSLAHLGVLLRVTGRAAEAVPLLRRCVEIRRRWLPEKSEGVAGALSVLGEALGESGAFDESRAVLLQARELRVGLNQPGDIAVAYICTAMARTLAYGGDTAAARREVAEAWRIAVAAREIAALERLEIAWLIAALAIVDGDRPAAGAGVALAQREYERTYAGILRFTAESQRLAMLRGIAPFDLPASAGEAGPLARSVLRTKGLVLDSLLEDEALARVGTDPETAALLERLHRVRAAAVRSSADAYFDEAEALEKQLATRVASIREHRRALTVEPAAVQAALPAGAALIEFVRYQRLGPRLSKTPAYGALVLARDAPPAWVPLGDEAALRPEVERLRLLAQSGGPPDWLARAHAALIAPVLAALPAATDRLYISPDGILHTVPWAVLRDRDGKYLAEKFVVAGVSSGRDLVPVEFTTARPARDLIVLAAPAFGRAAGAGPAGTPLLPAGAPLTLWRGLNLHDLPGARAEGEAVGRLGRLHGLTTVEYFGIDASEKRVRALEAPRVLHLATHGFVLPAAGRAEGIAAMDLAGLALAGGRETIEAWLRGERPPAENDGILTAREASALDLHGTELVVLSACETAAGEPAFGEGVFGLRRGFTRAGARNLLLTLWPVPDAETADFMQAFYGRLLAGATPEDALGAVRVETLRQITRTAGPVAAARIAGAFELDVHR